MASMSSAARLLLRGGKSAATQLLRGRPIINPTEARSLLVFNQTPMNQFPFFSESFPVMQTGFWACSVLGDKQGIVREADWLRTGTTMEAARGRRVVDEEDDETENDGDLDDVDIEDMDESGEDDLEGFDDDDDDDDDDDEEDEDEEKYIRKRK